MTSKVKTIQIHGNSYIPVSERVRLAHEAEEKMSITSEIIPSNTAIVIKATVVTNKGTFTGYSAANPNKAIEKMSPYEVAETSAIGRALGFAGYGIVDGIATADEVIKAEATPEGYMAAPHASNPAPTASKPDYVPKDTPEKKTFVIKHPELPISKAQRGLLLGKGYTEADLEGMNMGEASVHIDRLMQKPTIKTSRQDFPEPLPEPVEEISVEDYR